MGSVVVGVFLAIIVMLVISLARVFDMYMAEKLAVARLQHRMHMQQTICRVTCGKKWT